MKAVDEIWEASDKLNAVIRRAVSSVAFDDDQRNLGELISEERTRQELSLQDVATRAAMTKSCIWDFERGANINPTVKTMSRLAEALGIPFLQVCSAALRSNQP